MRAKTGISGMSRLDLVRRSALLISLTLAPVAAADPNDGTGTLTFSREIRYDPPRVEPLSLRRTVRLILPNSRPSRLDCTFITNYPVRGSIVGEIEEVARQIGRILEDQSEEIYGRRVAVSMRADARGLGAARRSELQSEGYRLVQREENGDRWGEAWCKEGYPADSDLGVARATVTFSFASAIDAVGAIRLNASYDVQVDRISGPPRADAALVSAMMAHVETNVRRDVSAVASHLNGRTWNLTNSDKQQFLDGADEIRKSVPFDWDDASDRVELTVKARLGRPIIVDTPGPP